MMALAPNTRRNALAGIDAFHVHVKTVQGADVLDRLLADLDVEALSSALEEATSGTADSSPFAEDEAALTAMTNRPGAARCV